MNIAEAWWGVAIIDRPYPKAIGTEAMAHGLVRIGEVIGEREASCVTQCILVQLLFRSACSFDRRRRREDDDHEGYGSS